MEEGSGKSVDLFVGLVGIMAIMTWLERLVERRGFGNGFECWLIPSMALFTVGSGKAGLLSDGIFICYVILEKHELSTNEFGKSLVHLLPHRCAL